MRKLFQLHGNGMGTDIDPLASQGSLHITSNKKYLSGVNAGSNDVFVFRIVTPLELDFIGVFSSGGETPISITSFGNIVYVLNKNSIQGYHIQSNGRLIPIDTYPLSTPCHQIGFIPTGEGIFVSNGRQQYIWLLVYRF